MDFSGAAVVGNNVVVESGNPAILYSLNSIDGSVNWTYLTQRASHASPAVAEGKIFSGSVCSNCPLEAVNLSDGTLNWSVSFPDGAMDPNYESGILYFASGHYIKAVNASTGVVVWTSPLLNDGITSVPAVANGKVYVGTWNSKMYAFNALTGGVLWNYIVSPQKHVIFSSPSIKDGSLYFGSGSAEVHSIDAVTSLQKWIYGPTDDSVWSSSALAYGNIYTQSLFGKVYALDEATGNLIWDYKTNAPPSSSVSSPAIANGFVYVGSTDGILYVFNALTGDVAWTYDTESAITASPIVANGMVYVGTTGGTFYAFGSAGNTLDVPYFSQIDEAWVDNLYDSMDATIGEVGCTLSAATMLLNYHGVDKLPDGSSLNVDSLNSWLNQNPDGAWRNGLTSWGALMRLSRILNGSDPDSPIFDYRKISPPDFAEIDRILTEEENPLIFEEIKPLSPSGVHFTTATGVIASAQEYSVLDPLDIMRSSFLIPPDELTSARYLYPTNTNLSYLVFHADEKLDVLITNQEESRSGTTRNGEEVNEILDAVVDIEFPIANDENPEQITGKPFWEFLIPDPFSGNYDIELNTDENGWYEFELYAYDVNAEVEVFKKRIYVGSDHPMFFSLEYAQAGGENFAVLNKVVDFDALKNDVDAMQNAGLINKDSVAKLLKIIVELAKNFYPVRPRLGLSFLDLFEERVAKYTPRWITEEAEKFLLEEVGVLREGL